jgi:hypothetical protein
MDASHNGRTGGSDDVNALASWLKGADLPPERAAAALLLLRLTGDDVDVDDAPDAVQALLGPALAAR